MKKAFTLLELIFVIVVVGILAAVIIPNTRSNSLQEVAVQLVSHIRYTQHLAMIDDKFDANEPLWYRQKWQLAFSTAGGTNSYMIFADSPSSVGAYDGNPGANSTYTDVEVAQNPASKDKYLIGAAFGSFDNSETKKLSNELAIGNKYGIGDVTVNGGGTGSNVKRILFDHLGRPYRGNTSSTSAAALSYSVDKVAISAIYVKLCTNTCVNPKTSANNANEIVIKIEPETGYAHIL
ncbi:pilus assembly FimT family protein [Sulfurimonas autotrophica]|uniref:N-terminal methylation n=1 Tax=Sulfurimonas autotrophica (strain ATCC BAA-671 / DSM 16294 / JCM 11897 / OK10) TaxID=563040 RepID=E0UV41_SULAO|nr:type II secretion system protein [Sulfurimonas autotrophica]ADN09623.1 N-terminal methylation [Sulfurimonas autotrophica DSM 16294]